MALGGMLTATGSSPALHPLPTEQPLAMDAAAKAEGAALADSTIAGAAADAAPAELTRAGKAADTVGAEFVTAPAAADTAVAVPAEVTTAGAGAGVVHAEVIQAAAENAAGAVPADVITTRVAGNTADAMVTHVTTAGAAAADAADAVLAESTRAAAAADTATLETAATGGSASIMNLLSQVADPAAGDAGEPARDAMSTRTQMDHTHSHVPRCKHVSMADELHQGSPAAFIAAAAFSGAKGGMLFKTGNRGLGYYADICGLAPEAPMEGALGRVSSPAVEFRCGATSLAAEQLKEHCNHADVDSQPISPSATMFPISTASCIDNVSAGFSSQAPLVKQVLPNGKAMHTGQKEGEALEGKPEGRYEAGVSWQVKGDGVDGKADEGDKVGHYWGQALQYLDRSIQVCL